MIHLTEKERSVLRAVYASEYADGSPRPCVWPFDIRPRDMAPASLPGVVASLNKKGILVSTESVTVTEAGEKMARELGIIF